MRFKYVGLSRGVTVDLPSVVQTETDKSNLIINTTEVIWIVFLNWSWTLHIYYISNSN
jgi:hypothetical protein